MGKFMNKLSISNCIRDWILLTVNNYFRIWKFLLLFLLIFLGFTAVVAGLSIIDPVLIIVAYLGFMVGAPGMLVALTFAMLSIARSEPVSLSQALKVGYGKGMWWRAIAFMTIFLLGIMAGFVALVIPGIYLMVSWEVAIYYLCDGVEGPIDCLGRSRLAVKEAGFMRVLQFLLAANMVIILIHMPFYFIPGFEFVGAILSLLTMPASLMYPAALYLSISKE